MANNNMTPEQDLITRQFFQQVANDTTLFPSDPIGQRNMNQCILRLLNYVYLGGAYVAPGTVVMHKLGQEAVPACEWAADTNKAMEAINGTDTSESEDQADSSESATDTEVREAVLREDV